MNGNDFVLSCSMFMTSESLSGEMSEALFFTPRGCETEIPDVTDPADGKLFLSSRRSHFDCSVLLVSTPVPSGERLL